MCLSVPGKLISIMEQKAEPGDCVDDSALWRTGKVSFGGILREVSLAYVPEAQVGDYVLVHVGFALSVIDETEAAETLSYLDQLHPVN